MVGVGDTRRRRCRWFRLHAGRLGQKANEADAVLDTAKDSSDTALDATKDGATRRLTRPETEPQRSR